MTEYNATQSKYRDRCKDRIQRQLEISACLPPFRPQPAHVPFQALPLWTGGDWLEMGGGGPAPRPQPSTLVLPCS